jgi:hypothetical protein
MHRYIILIIWILLVIIGLVSPRTILPFVKWQARMWGKISGFTSTPELDQILIKRMRIFYSIFLIFGLLMLFGLLTGKAK